jgi:hypothetical protein
VETEDDEVLQLEKRHKRKKTFGKDFTTFSEGLTKQRNTSISSERLNALFPA